MSYCRKCGRGLKNPESVKKGIGPICEKKEQADKESRQIELVPPKHHGELTLNDIPQAVFNKTYFGERVNREVNVSVTQFSKAQGTETSYNLRHIAYHSPDGFEFGYGGSGPADLARSILADCVGIKIADSLYHDFKWEFIVRQTKDDFEIKEQDIVDWVASKISAQSKTA